MQSSVILSAEDIYLHKHCHQFNISEVSNIFSVPVSCMNVLPQVLDGAGLDVDFFIYAPSGQVLFNDFRKSDGVHT